MDRDVSNRFCADAAALTLELGLYAADQQSSPDDSAIVRKIRVSAAAILAACDSVARMPMMVPPPMPEPVTPVPAAGRS